MFPIKILVIADDITGALDTGIQFSKANVSVQVLVNWDIDYNALHLEDETSVVVVNSQSRHMSGEKAAACVRTIMEGMSGWAPDLYYKKTDSVLRGNIGAELEAMMLASGANTAVFAPAFPKNGRTTQNGVQYVNGKPVSETAFGSDPFDPVKHSFVPDRIAEQSGLPVLLAAAGEHQPELSESGIYVFDAENRDQLTKAAAAARMNGIRVLAGCAGFAEVLPDIFGFPRMEEKEAVLPKKLTAISGTMNPVTIRQFQYVREAGMPVFSMKNGQICCAGYFSSAEGKAVISRILEHMTKNDHTIIEAADSSLRSDEIDSRPEVRETVAKNIGRLAATLFQTQTDAVFFLTGGDILSSVLKQMNCAAIQPFEEIASGVVLSSVSMNGQKRYIISKSGGFGSEDLILKMIDHLRTMPND